MGYASSAMLLAPSTWLMLCSAVFGVTWPQQTFKTEPLSVPEMKISKTGTTDNGYLFYGMTETSSSLKRPVIMKDDNELIWAGAAGLSPYNFKVQTYKDQPVLSYFTGHEDTFGHGYGEVVILDNSYKQVATICIKDTPEHHFVVPNAGDEAKNREYPCFNDYHESYITDRGSILISAFNVTRYDLRHWGGPQDGWIFNWHFFDIDIETNKVLFQWSAIENVDPKTSFYVNPNTGTLQFEGNHFGISQSEPWDFFHGNSVSPLPDGHFLVNSRMTHSMYKVNGTTGKVEWIIQGADGGDFQLGDPAPSFSWQHMARLIPQNYTENKFQISLFNDANIRGGLLDKPRLVSNGLLLNVDTENMTVSTARELIDQKNPVYSVAQGSYQTLPNGHVLIGYGAAPFIDEYDADNNLIYRAQFASRHQPIAHSYRAYKQYWKGYPKSEPKVLAQNGHVYASWNGATEYDAWNIYAGESSKNMVRVASNIPKVGFETHYKMKRSSSKYKYVMVEALYQGHVASRSAPAQYK